MIITNKMWFILHEEYQGIASQIINYISSIRDIVSLLSTNKLLRDITLEYLNSIGYTYSKTKIIDGIVPNEVKISFDINKELTGISSSDDLYYPYGPNGPDINETVICHDIPLKFVLLFRRLTVQEIYLSNDVHDIPHNIYNRCSTVVLESIDYDKLSLLVEILGKRSGGTRCLDNNEPLDIFMEGSSVTIRKYLGNVKTSHFGTSHDVRYEPGRKLIYNIIKKREINTVILDIPLINSWIYPMIGRIDDIKMIVIPRFWTDQEITLMITNYYTKLNVRQISYYIGDRLYELTNVVFLSNKSWDLTKIDHSFYDYFKHNFDYYDTNIKRIIRISITEEEREKYIELAKNNLSIVLSCDVRYVDDVDPHTKIQLELKQL